MIQKKNSEENFREKVQRRIKYTAQNLLLLLIGCILAFVILEIFLRVYNPFEFRVKGDKIILPANKEYIFENNTIEKLDKTIIHTKNSLGFRGDGQPEDFENHLTIITIGGSTTECFYLSDGKTWTDILGKKLKNVFKHLWINNAGLDGQSTFGHIVLMEDYIIKLRPKVVLFLVGLNDRGGIETFRRYDKYMMKQRLNFHSIKGFLRSTVDHSEVFALALNVYRYLKTRKMGIGHAEIDLTRLESIEIPEETKNRVIKQMHKKKQKYLKAYETRLKKLIQISGRNGIEPVFITQSALIGNTIDDITNVNLGKIKIEDMNGELVWEGLELYNDVTRQVGKRENVLVIDLAKEMPKSSRYYYDWGHYANEGAGKAAEIIYKFLCPFLVKKYNEYSIKDCNILTEI